MLLWLSVQRDPVRASEQESSAEREAADHIAAVCRKQREQGVRPFSLKACLW